MIIFAVVSTKGGVGKTTTSANLGALLADMGMRVLLVDGDVQPSLSGFFEATHRAQHGLTHVITTGSITPDSITHLTLRPSHCAIPRIPSGNPNGQLDLIASDDPEGRLQHWLGPRIDRATRLKSALHSPMLVDNYDVVIIDTQGAVGCIQDAAILASDQLISPVGPDVLTAREFTTRTQELLERLECSTSIGLAVPPLKAVLYKTDRTVQSRTYSTLIRERFVDLRGRVSVLNTSVPDLVAYKEAASAQLPVHWLDPHKAGRTLHDLAWELIPSLEGIRAHGMPPEEDSGELAAELTSSEPSGS